VTKAPQPQLCRSCPANPQEAAELAVEGLRTLNDAAVCPDYQRPSDVYAVMVELTLLTRELPKTLRRAATWLEAEHDAGRVGCDDGQNLTLAVHATLIGLHDAVRHLNPLLQALNTATQHAGHLTTRHN
jgi:hypothetical protein